MNTRVLIGIMCLVTFVGCSIAKPPTAANQMQIKVAQLERKLDEREREIAELKYEINDLNNQIQTQHSVSSVPRIDFNEPALNKTKNISSSKEDTRIIRVPVDERTVQTALKNAGYYTGAIDGKIGSGSKRAIRDFQKDHDLVADGIIGSKTWAELKQYLE